LFFYFLFAFNFFSGPEKKWEGFWSFLDCPTDREGERRRKIKERALFALWPFAFDAQNAKGQRPMEHSDPGGFFPSPPPSSPPQDEGAYARRIRMDKK